MNIVAYRTNRRIHINNIWFSGTPNGGGEVAYHHQHHVTAAAKLMLLLSQCFHNRIGRCN
jgi:hypothetical protein